MRKTFAPGAVVLAILIGFAMLLTACDTAEGPLTTPTEITEPLVPNSNGVPIWENLSEAEQVELLRKGDEVLSSNYIQLLSVIV